VITPAQFTVVGRPAPQGSKAAFKDKRGNARMKETSVGLVPWRAAVAAAARTARAEGGHTFTGPLKVTAQFRLPMPKSRPAWMRAQGYGLCEVAPDLDKLMRALGDAMKDGGLIGDDALIAVEHLSKVEVWDAWTGAVIRVQCLDPRAFLTELM
jgi:Holliday junction resolvase RusA-like endonuclease